MNDCLIMHHISLQATWIRNSLLRALRDSLRRDSRDVTSNFVYDHPTISALATFIYRLANNTGSTNDEARLKKANAMRAMADKYMQGFPAHVQTGPIIDESRAVVLITGTTRGFGTNLLARLAADTRFARIYALNRASKSGLSLQQRQGDSLAEMGLDQNTVHNEKLFLLHADVSLPDFGVGDELFSQVTYSS